MDIVSHQTLLRKIKVLAFSDSTIQLMRDYLTDRRQTVQVNTKSSPQKLTGPISVSQGSVFSCTLFLIYTMDMPEIFHSTKHLPGDNSNCPKPTLTAFVGDATILVKAQKDQDLQDNLNRAFFKIQNYLQINQLSQNKDKTKMTVITKSPLLRKQITPGDNRQVWKKTFIKTPKSPKNIRYTN